MGKSNSATKYSKKYLKNKSNKFFIKTIINFKKVFKKGIQGYFLQKSPSSNNSMKLKLSKNFNMSYTTLTILSINITIRAKISSIYKHSVKKYDCREISINKGTILIIHNNSLTNTMLVDYKSKVSYAIVTNDPTLDGCINSVLIEY